MKKIMNEKMKNRKGFTLIELIVVIAILGILAALAVPRLTGVQSNANKKAVVANLKTIDGAIQVYAANKNVPVKGVGTSQLNEGGDDALIPTKNWPKGPGAIEYTIHADGYTLAKLTDGVKGVGDENDVFYLEGDELKEQ